MTSNPIHERLNEPNGIADRLRALRTQAGFSGKQLAERIGWQPPKISKLEHGRQLPTVDDLEAWTHACGRPDAAERLTQLLRDIETAHRDWKRRLRQGGHAAVQAEFVTLTENASRVRHFETAVVPGDLQTPEYARAVFTKLTALDHLPESNIDAAVTKRMQRQQFLYDSNKEWEFLIDESVLWRPVYGVEIMHAQIDRLHSVIGLPNVKFGILPLYRPLTEAPQNSFALYDDVALVETFVGETRHTGDEAAAYHQFMDLLWENAVTDDEARQLILKASEALS
ncbi:MAG: helix-turn-helix domain-containing protein [Stackebrandtia sp.]